MRRIYLDHNATTPVHPAVREAMLPYLSAGFGNAGSVHWFGQAARAAVELAREQVAALIGAHPAEIVFTSGGTEADNMAILGTAWRFTERFAGGPAGARPFAGAAESPPPRAPAPHIITSAIEHAAVLHPCQALERSGWQVSYLPAGPEGVVRPEDVRRALRPETVLISVMHANNELGTIQPVEEIGRIAAEAGVAFHSDGVQSAGKIPVDAAQMGVQLLSISAHKIGGPKGAGALYVKKGTPLAPLVYGGQAERGRRAGTENVACIAGFGKAAELARAALAENSARMAALRDRLESGLLARVPGARVNCAGSPRTPNTSSILFPGADSESLVIALDLRGIACSAGAACSSGAVSASHVLAAIGLSPDQARACVRFSVGSATGQEEVDAALEIIPAVVAAHCGAHPSAAMAAK